MEPASTISGGTKFLSLIFKPAKWAWKKVLNLEKINQLQDRITALEEECFELKNKIAVKENPLPSDAIFISKLGVWFSKSVGLHFCTSCRKNGDATPLLEQKEGWMCKVKGCGQWYRKPSVGFNEVASFDLSGPAY